MERYEDVMRHVMSYNYPKYEHRYELQLPCNGVSVQRPSQYVYGVLWLGYLSYPQSNKVSLV